MMKGTCSRIFAALVDLAEGRESAEAAAHVAQCASCAGVLRDLERGVRSLRAGFYDAPADVTAAAKSIFPLPVRVAVRLLGTTLAGAGARGETAVQAAYEFEGGRARILYQPEEEGWSVMARVEGEGWRAFPAELDEQGRVEFRVQALGEARLRLVREGVEVVIDPPSEEADASR